VRECSGVSVSTIERDVWFVLGERESTGSEFVDVAVYPALKWFAVEGWFVLV
jgi:hypothetical protein